MRKTSWLHSSTTMSSSAAKRARRADEILNEDTEGHITDFLTTRELGRVRTTERRARNRTYSAAVTKIVLPKIIFTPLSFLMRYHLDIIVEIDATESPITDTDLQFVSANCPQLSSLNLSRCYDVTDAGVTALGQNGCPQLSSLNLSYCYNIKDASLVALAQGCPLLSSVYLLGCTAMKDIGVIALARGCRQLSSLDLGYCSLITNQSLIALAQNCPQLIYLNFSHCFKVTDVGVIALAKHCLHLSDIEFYLCRKITNASLFALARGCQQLSYLGLGRCIRITNMGVNALANCREITDLDLRGTGVQDEWAIFIENAQRFFDKYLRRHSSSASNVVGAAASQLVSQLGSQLVSQLASDFGPLRL
jgi:hypothetical protein